MQGMKEAGPLLDGETRPRESVKLGEITPLGSGKPGVS